ncbi:MAG: RluA family pseudouridine synthase [Planctomycetes bacterium]|nr:RluA family pseudouridine synthase [Planctomycetota bacterium]
MDNDRIHEVGADSAGERLDKWLAAPERLGSRKRAAQALERGKVFVDGEVQTLRDGGRPVKVGSRVRVWLDRPGTAKPSGLSKPAVAKRVLGRLKIVHDDEDLIVIDKPAGLLTVPREGSDGHDDTVLARLEAALDRQQRRRLFIVHRIDRWTTGLVVVARSAAMQEVLREQFFRRTPQRRYLTVLCGGPDEESGTWTDSLIADPQTRIQRRCRATEPGVEAISHFRVVERFGDRASLLQVDLVTGKRNQIRVQAALRGLPLIGERLYTSSHVTPTIEFTRQALHAHRLVFQHPRTGTPLECVAPLPADMKKLLRRLREESGLAGSTTR